MSEEQKKQCTRCRIWQSLSNFSRDRHAGDGHITRCKTCNAEIQRKTRNPQWSRKYTLRSLYNITPQQYDRMLAEQGGVCAVCKKPETHRDTHSDMARLLSVDHDHQTGDARALLCSSCNLALGRMNEDPQLIRALAEYAEWCKIRKPSVKIVQLPLLDQQRIKNNGTA